MTSATTQAGLTLRTFLLGSGPEDDTAKIRQLLSEKDVVSRCGGDLSRLTQQGRSGRGATRVGYGRTARHGPGRPAHLRLAHA
jgi:hypothetical protein